MTEEEGGGVTLQNVELASQLKMLEFDVKTTDPYRLYIGVELNFAA